MPTQKTDIFNPTGPAVQFLGSGVTWTIANGVLVGSAGFPAVFSSHDGSKLVNKGVVFTHADTGVFFQVANHGTVINKAGASIIGAYGVIVGNVPGAKNMTVMNDGSIIGLTGYGVAATDVSNFDLTNSGHIFGPTVGVYATVATAGPGDGPTIENSGSISSAQFGVYVSTLPGLKATIVNKSGGTIKGDTASIDNAGAGNLSVENHGKLKGNIFGNVATDKVVNDGTIKGETYLGPGNDTFKNIGGHAGRVHGGDGNDTLIAGPHKDQFVFDSTLNAATNVDRVKHFDPGTDKLILDQSYFGALSGPGTLAGGEFHKGAAAHDGDDHIIYNKHTGALFYDPDGTGGSPQVEFAKLDKGLHLHANDFVVIA